MKEEHRELHGESRCCPLCGLPYRTFPGEEESDIFKIEVNAYRRRIHRKRCQKSCSCISTSSSPAIIVAPPPPKIIPRSPYGTSIWIHILLSLTVRELPEDWQKQYNIKPALMETFVEYGRFAGTCYKAANWVYVGKTKGRGKLGPFGRQSVPIKDVWLYPLQKDFIKILNP